jgi:hypothetical protein
MWHFNGAEWLVEYEGKFVTFGVLKPKAWFWDFGITVPKYQNWSRLDVNLPFGAFSVNGWLLWGRLPEGHKRLGQ